MKRKDFLKALLLTPFAPAVVGELVKKKEAGRIVKLYVDEELADPEVIKKYYLSLWDNQVYHAKILDIT